GDLGEGSGQVDGVGRVRQGLHRSRGGVDPHRVRGDGDPGGGGDDRAARDGGGGEGELLLGAAGQPARRGILRCADPHRAAALVVGGRDEGGVVEPDVVDPVVKLGPHRSGLAGGEVEQLGAGGEGGGLGPGAVPADQGAGAVGAELAGTEIDLRGG